MKSKINSIAAMPHFKLTYFDLRGRAEPIRMMFAIAGISYEDVRIEKDDWSEQKKIIGTPFDALPMLEIDGVKVAQTLAILRYIARENGYAGPDNLTAAIADSYCDQFVDFLTATYPWLVVSAGHVQGDEVAVYKSDYLPAREKHFPFFEAALNKSTTGWYAGTTGITHADVFIDACLEFLIRLDKKGNKIFEGFPLMGAHYKKFFTLPAIQKHVAERPDAKY